MRDLLIEKIELLSNNNHKFKTEFWEDIFYTNEKIHVSEINYTEFSDKELIDYYEYLIEMSIEVSFRMVRKHVREINNNNNFKI